MNPDITYDGIFGAGWGVDAPPAAFVSEFGSGMPVVASAPAAGAVPAIVNGGGRDFWRSSDFGLILFGLALLYFDMRLINRGS
jgi:hypothetical protein